MERITEEEYRRSKKEFLAKKDISFIENEVKGRYRILSNGKIYIIQELVYKKWWFDYYKKWENCEFCFDFESCATETFNDKQSAINRMNERIEDFVAWVVGFKQIEI